MKVCNLDPEHLNVFLANVTILQPLKTPESQRFSGVFRGVQNGNIGQKKVKWNELQILLSMTP